jgi:hypothetical protein
VFWKRRERRKYEINIFARSNPPWFTTSVNNICIDEYKYFTVNVNLKATGGQQILYIMFTIYVKQW